MPRRIEELMDLYHRDIEPTSCHGRVEGDIPAPMECTTCHAPFALFNVNEVVLHTREMMHIAAQHHAQ